MAPKITDYLLLVEEFKTMEVRGYFKGDGYEEQGGTAMETERLAPAITKLADGGAFEGKTVLDYGAGKGRHSRYLRSKGIKVYGYDPFNGSDEDGWNGVAKTLPKGKVFDVVICAYVINVVQKHIQDEILKEIRNLASDNAYVISRSDDVFVLLKGIYANIVDGKETNETKLLARFFNEQFAKDEDEKKKFAEGTLPKETLNELCFYGFPTTKGFQRIPNDPDVEALGFKPMTLSAKFKLYRFKGF